MSPLLFIVEGSWNSWNAWGTCSASCGTGTQSRTRSFSGGMPCSGSSTDAQNCQGKAEYQLKQVLCHGFQSGSKSKLGRPKSSNLGMMQLRHHLHGDQKLFCDTYYLPMLLKKLSFPSWCTQQAALLCFTNRFWKIHKGTTKIILRNLGYISDLTIFWYPKLPIVTRQLFE